MAEPARRGATGYVILMYHEIEQRGRPISDASPGYVRYVVSESEFRGQLDLVRAAGLKGSTVSTILNHGERREQIAFSFDDGCATDRAVAAEALNAAGFGATFFIVPGWLGRTGYLSRDAVRELSDAGFEIGSHSMQHHFLTALPDAALAQDLRQSKQELEALCGRAIELLSCPGGRWSPAVARGARAAGYRAVATSRPAVNTARSDPYRLARVAIRRGTAARKFHRWCQGQGLAGERLRGAVLSGVRTMLGDSFYHTLQQRLGR